VTFELRSARGSLGHAGCPSVQFLSHKRRVDDVDLRGFSPTRRHRATGGPLRVALP
jgi:hypothetical protein